jgi:hypothetical protein
MRPIKILQILVALAITSLLAVDLYVSGATCTDHGVFGGVKSVSCSPVMLFFAMFAALTATFVAVATPTSAIAAGGYAILATALAGVAVVIMQAKGVAGCEASRKWTGTPAEQTTFNEKKKQLLLSAVTCTQYVLKMIHGRLHEFPTREKKQQWLVKSGMKSLERQCEVIAFFEQQADNLLQSHKVAELDRWCGDVKNVAAQNWGKGDSYKICVQVKPSKKDDMLHQLNSVESIVAVLLHEVAHTIHQEQEETISHSDGFHEINTFLVNFANCKLNQASPAIKKEWKGVQAGPFINDKGEVQASQFSAQLVNFDPAKLAKLCQSPTPISFCGVKVPVGQCNGKCEHEA